MCCGGEGELVVGGELVEVGVGGLFVLGDVVDVKFFFGGKLVE